MQASSLQDACRHLDDSKIIECINKGIDKSLGPNLSQIILKTLKVAYGLDEKDIPTSLDAFESSLRKALGDLAASIILESIANECSRAQQNTDHQIK